MKPAAARTNDLATRNPMLPRVVPFGLYMLFVALGEIPGLVSPETLDSLYPLKTALVVGALLLFRKQYTELRAADLANAGQTFCSVLLGLAVFAAWVNLDQSWAVMGTMRGYVPAGEGLHRTGLLAVRVFGAAVAVPFMEELFWRSFLVRWLMAKDFTTIPVGRVSPFAFLSTAVLFGFEHQLWVAGILAGLAYNLLLVRTRSIAQCVLCHAVTNAALAWYVLQTGAWKFW